MIGGAASSMKQAKRKVRAEKGLKGLQMEHPLGNATLGIGRGNIRKQKDILVFIWMSLPYVAHISAISRFSDLITLDSYIFIPF